MAKKQPNTFDLNQIQKAAKGNKPPPEQSRNKAGEVEPEKGQNEKRKVASYTLKPEYIKAIKQRANQLSTDEKRISASQALESILAEYFGEQ